MLFYAYKRCLHQFLSIPSDHEVQEAQVDLSHHCPRPGLGGHQGPVVQEHLEDRGYLLHQEDPKGVDNSIQSSSL